MRGAARAATPAARFMIPHALPVRPTPVGYDTPHGVAEPSQPVRYPPNALAEPAHPLRAWRMDCPPPASCAPLSHAVPAPIPETP